MRERLRERARKLRRSSVKMARRVLYPLRWWKEVLVNVAILGGLTCLGYAVSELTGRPKVVAAVCGFVALWGYAGFGYIARLFQRGLYTLTVGEGRDR